MLFLITAKGRAARVGRLGVLLLTALVAGCGPGKVKVSGQVLLDGTALPGGLVTFRPADPSQNSVSAALDRNGRYEAELPTGDVAICVDNRELEPQEPPSNTMPDLPDDVKKKLSEAGANPPPPPAAPPAAPKPNPNYRPISPRYYEIETSALHFKVAPGHETYDIQLTK